MWRLPDERPQCRPVRKPHPPSRFSRIGLRRPNQYCPRVGLSQRTTPKVGTSAAHQEHAVTSSTPIETPLRMAEAGARTGAIRQRWLDVVTPHCGAIQEQRALLISSRARLLRARRERSSSRARRHVELADRDAAPHSGGRRSNRRDTPAVAGRGYTALRCYPRAASTAD